MLHSLQKWSWSKALRLEGVKTLDLLHYFSVVQHTCLGCSYDQTLGVLQQHHTDYAKTADMRGC